MNRKYSYEVPFLLCCMFEIWCSLFLLIRLLAFSRTSEIYWVRCLSIVITALLENVTNKA
jgi:hypothetical protein